MMPMPALAEVGDTTAAEAEVEDHTVAEDRTAAGVAARCSI